MMDDKVCCGIEQWKTCVEMANKNSEKRNSMNSLFVTINSALIAAISMRTGTKTTILAIVGCLICFEWKILLKSYYQLNSAKCKIINDIERDLPYKPFTEEWKILKRMKYSGLCSLEKVVPMSFVLLYVFVIITNAHAYVYDRFVCGS